MIWRALAEADVLDRLADEERDSYEDAGEEEGATARLPGIMSQITALIRGAIAQNGSNYLGADGTLPEAAIYHAATLARQSLIGTQPTSEGETNPREREERAAWKYIEGIQEGKITFNDDSAPRDASSGEYGGKCYMEF